MNTESRYLSRYGAPKLFETNQYPKDSDIIVVIPAYNEPRLMETIESLFRCPVDFQLSILVVINYPDSSTETIRELSIESHKSLSTLPVPSKFDLRSIVVELPNKKAGVGMARKYGMDEAVRWFEASKKRGFLYLWMRIAYAVKTTSMKSERPI